MQKVSDNWKNEHEELLLNESYVEVSIDIGDPDAIADASSLDNGASYLSDSSLVVDGVERTPPKYATLEENLWLLDGNRKVVPLEGWDESGYIGSLLSDENGGFESIPIVTIDFGKVHRNLIPGITIKWGTSYGEYAEAFRIVAYNGDTEVANARVNENTSVTSIVELDIVNYDRICIEIIKWCLPYHRPRISEIFIGISKVYDKQVVMSYNHEQEVSPIGAITPIIKSSFSLDNTDEKFNPYNEEGLSKYLLERQEINIRYGLKLASGEIEYIPGGVLYLSEWNAPQNGLTAEFVARDLLEFMRKTYIKGQVHESGRSLYDLAVDVLTDADLPLNKNGSVRWVVDDSLKNIYTTAPLPLESSAICLQYIGQAGRCVLYSDRKGTLHLEPISTGVQDYELSSFNLYSRPEVTLQKPLSGVTTKVYKYFAEAESKELFNGSVLVDGTEDVIITYSNTATNVTAAVTNGTLVSAAYYANACCLRITGNGEVEVTLTGNIVNSSTSDYTLTVSTDGEVQSVDNPLITSAEVASNVNIWVKDNLLNRKTVKIGGWRADPRLDATDIISSVNKYGTDNIRVTNVNYSYNGAFRGTLEGNIL
jgi:hypothetical protein